jgi:hypothetical protein
MERLFGKHPDPSIISMLNEGVKRLNDVFNFYPPLFFCGLVRLSGLAD